MKSFSLGLGLFTAVLLATSTLGAPPSSFRAELSGENQVPAVKTKAKGDVEFKVAKDGKELSYRLTVKDIENVTAAHVHRGKMGQNGPPVVGLFGGAKKAGAFSGVLSEGTITEKDLMGDLKGKSMEEVVKFLGSGDAYVNVHTDANPGGEVRGQVK